MKLYTYVSTSNEVLSVPVELDVSTFPGEQQKYITLEDSQYFGKKGKTWYEDSMHKLSKKDLIDAHVSGWSLQLNTHMRIIESLRSSVNKIRKHL